jgi:amino acid adenylation domain-containing protein
MPIEEKTHESAALSDAKRRLLAQRLKGAASPALQADRIRPRPVGSRTVLGPDQYNIWLDATLHPETPAYNEIVTIFYSGELDAALLEQAFNAFLARHEGWRTSYRMDQGEVLQVIHPEVRIAPLHLIDLAHLPFEEADAESKRLATEQARRFLSLEEPPLIRATLVRLAPNDCRMHLTLSHMIFDGYSIRRTFLVELATIYAALEAGTEPNLPPVELHYADYTNWRTQHLDSPHIKAQLDFWRKKLAGELPLLRLPSDRPRPAVITHRGGIERFTISRELTEALRVLGKPYRASFYMTLLASFKVLLFRYSGQNDIIIGSVADGRRRPELESMMGYMIDVFAVRSQPEASLKFSEYLTQVRQTVLESIGAAEVPFQRVVETVGAKRDLSHAPLFQTLFVLEPPQEPYGKWSVAATEITLGASKYDLYVEADEHATHTGVSIDYSTDLFDAPTIRRMMGHWQTMLQAIVANPDTTLGDLPILTPAERETLLVGWNDTAVPIPATTMHGLVEAQVARTPNAPAVSFAGQTLTYAQLEGEATQLAQALREAGAAPETLAAVFLDRSQHLPAALLAVLKTGAAYMPLDPGTPAARIALCLEDGNPPVILTQRSRLGDLPASTAKVLVLEEILAQPYRGDFIAAQVAPEDLAYVIHTSGSTGRPKGVELRHAGVVNFLLSMQREPGFTAADTLVAVTTISFDIAVLELFLPLITGGKVIIASRETALDPSQLAALLAESGATVLQATPATWSSLIGINWRGLKGLKVLCGGEALKISLADRLLGLGLDLWNVYGPTETTIWSTIAHVEPSAAVINVGRPIANTTAYILDAQRQPVPIGVPGELYLGGIGVARGYRHKPELTAEKFVAPVVACGERVYRTGDYALYRENGAIEIQGRSDNQVKIRGYRIELEDVEVNLAQHPRVAAAAAKAWPDPDGGHRLCAYLTGVDGPAPNAAELRQFLRGRVADYMIPSEIVALDALPLTSNGKVDRKQLAEPDRTAKAATQHETTLRGEELRLAHLWSELLHVENITATDNFFDLGGHSLLLLKLVRQVKKEFSIELPMARLFQAPTIEKLAAVVRELKQNDAGEEWNSLVPLNPRGSKRPLFLVHSLMLYGRLPAALGEDQPFYALQPLPFEVHPSNDYVERMLEDHIRQIKRVQPQGPYQIAGWCFAGWLAYEVARRLEAAGERVTLLALLDSWCPYKIGPSAEIAVAFPTPMARRHGLLTRLRSLLFKVRFRFGQIVGVPKAERGGHIRRMIRDTWANFWIPIERDIKALLYRFHRRFNVPMPAMLRDSNVVTYAWLRNYQLQPYGGDIALIRPGDIAVPPDSDPNCGWRALTTGTISTTFVPGDRSTMFLGHNLTLLADVLRSLMAR